MSEIKTLSDVKQSGLFGTSNFDSIINNSMQVLNNHPELVSERGMDIGDTPISPMTLDDDYTPILFSKEVMSSYEKLVNIINITETAKEYSFVLLGKSGTLGDQECYLVDQIIDCNSKESGLNSRVTKIDEQKLNQAIRFALQNGYNFISIGHTHPNIPEEEKNTTIANYLSDEVRNSEYIREAGLNLSLQDFISYESLYQYFAKNPNIKTAQTVIMFNGEIAMVCKTGSSLNRLVFLMDRATGKEIYVSSKEDFDKLAKDNSSFEPSFKQ